MSNAMNTPPDPSGRSQQLHTRRQKGASSAWSCAVEPKSALSLRVKADVTGCAAGVSKTRDGRRRILGLCRCPSRARCSARGVSDLGCCRLIGNY